jgi:outer membrane protein assembly factor BamB
VEGPLAAHGSRLLVATRDGTVHAFDRTTGRLSWQAAAGGILGQGEGAIVVRGTDGTVSRLQPRTGGVLWKTQTGIKGALHPVLDRELILVAGDGLAALEADSGRVVWSIPPGSIASTVPVPAGARILLGETDGTLRCRDRATGASLWTRRFRSAIVAPPLVAFGRRVFVGTTERRFVALDLDKGQPGWKWRLGVDVQSTAVPFRDDVVFAALDGVLYALRHGNGHLAWRAALPSRPLAAPVVKGDAILVACAENEILGFDGKTGARLGGLQTGSVIRTPPLLIDGHVYVGLSEPSVKALALAGFAAPSPATGDPASGPAPPQP